MRRQKMAVGVMHPIFWFVGQNQIAVLAYTLKFDYKDCEMKVLKHK
jgi:hypothetical protein